MHVYNDNYVELKCGQTEISIVEILRRKFYKEQQGGE